MNDLQNRLNVVNTMTEDLKKKTMGEHYDAEYFRAHLRHANTILKRIRHVKKQLELGKEVPESVVTKYNIDPKDVISATLNPIQDKYRELDGKLQQLKDLVDASSKLLGFRPKNVEAKLNKLQKVMKVELSLTNLFEVEITDEDFKLSIKDFIETMHKRYPLATGVAPV